MKSFLVLIFIVSFGFNLVNARELQADSVSKASTNKVLVSDKINHFVEPVVNSLSVVLFWDPFAALGLYDPVMRNKDGTPVLNKEGKPVTRRFPFVVFWLISGAIFCTLYFKFVNFRAFKLSIAHIRGKFDHPDHEGQVSHFQALTTALSATVGLGNIAGVAIAISLGGPGATFWIIAAGLLGMSSKFAECTLAVKYRKVDENGQVSGGPMYYIREGLSRRNFPWTGKVLAFVFAVFIVIGSFGIGNMFQSNQAFAQFELMVPALKGHGFIFGCFMAFLTGLVIIGGIKSIARVTSKIVPFMAVLYIGVSLIIIFMNIEKTGEVLMLIIKGAFIPDAMKGGFIGVLIIGFQRAAFSNEAGIGSAPIAHSMVRTRYPASEGIVALLEPFIDSVVICTITALVLIFTGFYQTDSGITGSQLTSMAFGSVFPWFQYILLGVVFLFAYSTMISWSFYGMKGFNYLMGEYSKKWFGSSMYSERFYQFFFLCFVVIGSSTTLGAVMDFSDMLILCMAFPNIICLVWFAPEIRAELARYMNYLKMTSSKSF